MNKKKFIILGYGNPDRGDDGVAYHILQEIIRKYTKKKESLSEFIEIGTFELTADIDLWYNLQLIPEVSELLSSYENAIFIDAHTAEIPDPIKVRTIEARYSNSPFTHHLTPESCIELAQKLFDHAPISTLITIRGYEFDFYRGLSEETQKLANQALDLIYSSLECE